MTGFAAGTLGRLALLSALTLTVSCQRKAVCDDVAGSCLALTVVGQGPFDELRTELALPGGAKKVGVTSGNIDLPLTLRVLPPDGVSSATISAVGVAGFVAGTSQASGSTGSDFSWPDGAHIAATVALQGASPVDAGVNDMSVVVDQGTLPDLTMPDLAGPPPTLRWTQESATGNPRQMLYGVFSGGSGQTFAVGESGIILARGATATRERYGPWLIPLVGLGLVIAVIAALIGIYGGGFFHGMWLEFYMGEDKIKMGTPQLFDLGVMLVVIGMAVTYLLRLSEAAESVTQGAPERGEQL